MIENFKCGSCGCTKAHTKDGAETKTNRILDIRNPALNARLVFMACADCHIVHAFWEDFKTASDISDKDKEIAHEVLTPENEITQNDVEKSAE